VREEVEVLEQHPGADADLADLLLVRATAGMERVRIDADSVADHLDEVFYLDDETAQRVLSLLPRLARFLSEIINERRQLLSKLDAIAALAGASPTKGAHE